MTETINEGRPALVDKVRVVGEALAESLRPVLQAIPGRPVRPNQLSRSLGLNRATSSKLLIALAKGDPLEILHAIPGPEPLRSFLAASALAGVAEDLIVKAGAAVTDFEVLIRDDAGTRSALDAIISSNLPDAREKFELASKYSIFKGMSQLKGVRADTWLGTAVVTPSKTSEDRHDLTWLTGAFAIQRLRSDVTVGFSYRSMGDSKTMAEKGPSTSLSSLPMDRFCANPPAPVASVTAGDVIHYTLPGESVGPRHLTDMLVVDDHPAAMRRLAKTDSSERNLSSLFVEPAFPVTLLVFDMLLHKDAFPGAVPELVIYDTGTKGIANVNDPTRDIDRMDMRVQLESLPLGDRRFRCAEIPNYEGMIEHLAGEFDWDLDEYRAFRCCIQYPVYGWQISMSFEPPH